MKYKFYAEITCNNKKTKEIIKFDDIYYFSCDLVNIKYDYDNIIEYIKRDLILVAGGGYTTKNIENAIFNINQLREA